MITYVIIAIGTLWGIFTLIGIREEDKEHHCGGARAVHQGDGDTEPEHVHRRDCHGPTGDGIQGHGHCRGGEVV